MEKTIQQSVAEKISLSGKNVAEIVIDKLAEIEIHKRVDIITEAINKQDQIEKDFNKINKNDNITYVDNKPVESMSKNRYEEIKKIREQKERLVAQINDALEKNTTEDYNKLSQTIKSIASVGGNQKENSKEG